MPVKIACPKCSKKYTLPDSAVGKAVKCKACETTFRTKMPSGAAPSPQPAKPVQPKPVQQRPSQPVSPNLDQFGIDGGFQQQADIFGSPPQAAAGLGNFAEEDTFGESVQPIVLGPAGASAAPAENPYQSVMTNSSMRGSSARNKARRKKRGGAVDVSAYGIVRVGMLCVFGFGAAIMLAGFASILLGLLGLIIGGANGSPRALDAVVGIVGLLAFGLGGISFLGMIVGQIMCMFAPNGNERFNSIGAGVLLFLAMVGGVVSTIIFGVAVGSATGPGGPSVAGLVSAGIGYLAATLICGVMFITAMFMFVNFYRRVGQNINSDALVKVSNQATIAVCVSVVLPFLGFGLAVILGMAGLEEQAAGFIIGAFYLLSMLLNLVVAAVILRLVWAGASSLKPE